MRKRQVSPVMALGCMVIALIVFVVVAGGALVSRWDDADRRRDCIARLEAQMTASALDALAAPPVDPKASAAEVAATPRGKAIAAGLAVARKLHDPDAAC